MNNIRNRRAFLLILAFCMAYTCFTLSGTVAYAAESSIWHSVGNIQISNGGAAPPAITTDENGTPFIAYGDSNHSNKAVVKRFNGSSWVAVGTEGFSDGQINYIAIAIDRDGVPFVVFGERDFNDPNSEYKATVMKYDDSECEWVEVGSTRFTSGGIQYPSIAFDSNNNPYISFAHYNGTAYVATVMKYIDGENGWISVGGALSTARVTYVSMAMDSNDAPYVAYSDGTSNSFKATVKKFNGATWATVGSSTCFTPGVANYTSIVIDKSTNTPYIAYSDYANSRKATVQKYNGSSWETVDGAGFSEGEARYISLALDSSGNPYVSYQDTARSDMATVMKYNGSNWETVGSPGFSEETAAYICLALDSADIPYIIFYDSSYVKVMNYAPPAYEMSDLKDRTFTQLMKGYAAGTQQAAEITVNRTGTGVLTNLAVSLSGDDAGNFTVTQPSLTELDDTNTSTTFTVKSADGLMPGIYSATVTVTAEKMTAVSFSVSQTVTEEAAVSIGGTVLYGMDPSELDSSGVSVDNGVYTLDCSKIDGGSGTAVYDSSTDTLTLNSAVIPGTTDSDGHGLYASVGDLILELNGDSTFGIAGDTNTVSDFYVKNGGVTVRDGSGGGTGSLELYGHNSSSDDAAAGFISDGDFNFEDGSYHFIGNGYYSYGLAAYEIESDDDDIKSNINITGGSIDVDIDSPLNTGTDASYLSAAIMAYGDMNVGGGDLDLCVTGAGMGIMASDVNIYGANTDISVSAEDPDEFGTGIHTGNEFRMEGGTVNIHVTAATIATAVYGVSPNSAAATVTGGTLIAAADGGAGFGLSYDQVIISGGTVSALGNITAINAKSVTCDGTTTVLYNTTPRITAAETAAGTVSQLNDIIFDPSNQMYTDSMANAITYLEIKAPPATLQSIAITTPAAKLVYTVGDSLDISGMVVTGTYSDSSTKTETITTANVTGFDSSTAVASQTLTVTVGGKTATYTVAINAAPVITYTVTFNKNGGDTEANPTTKTAASGGNIGTLPTAPTREGYTFAGWNIAQDGGGATFTAATAVTSDMTVYAQWTLNPPTDDEKVAADKAALEIGFAAGDSARAVTQDLNLTVTGAVYGSTISWVSGNTAVISNGGVVIRPAYASGDANVTVTATVYSNGVSDTKDFSLMVLKLVQITHTVTFKDWDGTVLKTQTVNDGAAATAPSDPSRMGYTFTGWDKAFDNVTSDLTVTAQYSQNPVLTYSIAPISNQTMMALTSGYTSGTQETKTITVTRTGTGDISNLAVALSGTNASSFTITQPSVTILNSSTPSTIFTVKAKDGLAAGTYTATVTINATNMSNVVFTVTQAVNNPSENTGGGTGGGGGGGGSLAATPPTGTQNTETTVSGNTATASTTATATVDGSGKATVSVTQAQVNDIVSKAAEEAAKQGNGAAAVVEIKVEGAANAKTVEVGLPKTAVETLAKSNTDALTVSTPIAEITFDSKALDTIAQAAAADVKISAEKVDTGTLDQVVKQAVGDRPVYNFSVTSGSNTISQFGGNVTVSVPYTPKPGEDANAIVIYYINAQGRLETVSNCHYDPATGKVTFTTNHFSQYVVGYNKVTFKDVEEDAWYGKAVGFIAARGITAGTGSGNFSPEAKLTRGEFIVMMMKAYDIKADENPRENFSDAGSIWYTGYLAAAKRLGISGGVGNNRFAPEKEINRQEMFTLLYNALKVTGGLPKGNSGKRLTDFTDAGQIASWAKDAMTLLAETGTIGGNNGMLTPTSTTTRAEMAQVLYNLLSK